jgi:3-deoxy-manno-octulosonate cytidylyltransferase (CMP-KDO synthetase)
MVVLLDDNTLLTCATDATIEEMNDPDTVKVVCAGNGNALYFSRSSIPHCRGKKGFTGHRHIGIYGFSRMGIARFCAFPRGKLEKAEKLEQLRALEAGMNVRCLFRRYSGFGIDTPRDVVKFRKVLETRQGRKDCKDMTA